MNSVSEAPPILEVMGLSKAFGGVQAVHDCRFEITQRVTGIIGPNGAGKSTLIGLLSGTLLADAGRICFGGNEITRMAPHRRSQLGLTRTFQISRQFHTLSVLENLLVASPDADDRLIGAIVLRRQMKRRDRESVKRSLQVLEDVGLYAKRDDRAGELSGGQMRLLEIARAIIRQPKLVLFDEPTAGVNPVLIERVEEQLRNMAESGTTVLLVEHNLKVVERMCDSVIVVANGSVIAVGSMEEHRANDEVVKAYLGTGEA